MSKIQVARDKAHVYEQAGFTLIELLLVIFISVMLLGALFGLFVWHSRVYNYQQAVIAVAGSARQAMSAIGSYTVQAYRVVASHNFAGTTYSSGPETLVLQLPAVDANGNILAGSWDYVVFYRNNNELLQTMDVHASSTRLAVTKTHSATVSGLTFTYDDPDFSLVHKVAVDLQTQQQVKEQTVTNQLQENLYIRNY
jgi:prepilin-type N-terminal cleavage/methylation domain-containing protein